jgi:ribosomal protein S18 acetylase RimI-like enzyme|tara:strand:- start:1078 stop:1599 length:522 start_codon:yes stop_codon:yes gene_type:complete
MSEYIIKQPVPEDVDGLIAMHQQSWRDTYPNVEHGISQEYVDGYIKRFSSDEGREKRLGYIHESHSNPDYYLRVAKDGDRIVGFVDARRGEIPELCGLYVDASAQGSGLAQQMAESALRWLGLDHDIKLVVVDYNQRAQSFYKKLGFNKVPGSEKFYKNEPLTVIEMVRKGDQ